MDAREDVVGLLDALGAALAHGVERAAAGAVDAGEAEDVEGYVVAAIEIEPAGFGRDAAAAAFAGGAEFRRLIDPAAVAIAIDAGGREIAGPAQVREPGDVGGVFGEDGIACFIGRDRGEEMRRARKRFPQDGPSALEAMHREPLRGKARAGRVVAARAGNAPALSGKRTRQESGAVAKAEAEERRDVGRHGWLALTNETKNRPDESVTPAKAGVQKPLDSRFRANDGTKGVAQLHSAPR